MESGPKIHPNSRYQREGFDKLLGAAPPLLAARLKTGFAAESGQIRKNRTFSNLRGLNLCTSHILVFGCLRGQDVVGS